VTGTAASAAVLLAVVVFLALVALGCRAELPPPGPPSVNLEKDAGPPRADARPEPDAAAPPADAAPPDAPPAARDTAPADMPPADLASEAPAAGGCGHERPDVSGIMNVDGLAVDSDGTLYFGQGGVPDGWVGRLRPGGGAPERQWLRVPAGDRLWGLAVDSKARRLYVASTGGKAVHVVDLAAATPALATLASGLMAPNDVAVGPEGHVYYSDQTDRHVHRVAPDGTVARVTASPVGVTFHPAGLAFGSDGALYVGTSAGNGPILRLELQDGVEVARRSYGHYLGWGNGLAFDTRGRLYLSTYAPSGVEARVVRIASDESGAIQITAGPRFASMAFGRGALGCQDLYIAAPAGPLQRFAADAPGLPLP
jgi:hypothetical protein